MLSTILSALKRHSRLDSCGGFRRRDTEAKRRAPPAARRLRDEIQELSEGLRGLRLQIPAHQSSTHNAREKTWRVRGDSVCLRPFFSRKVGSHLVARLLQDCRHRERQGLVLHEVAIVRFFQSRAKI